MFEADLDTHTHQDVAPPVLLISKSALSQGTDPPLKRRRDDEAEFDNKVTLLLEFCFTTEFCCWTGVG